MNATDDLFEFINSTEVTSNEEQVIQKIHGVILGFIMIIVIWIFCANTVIVVCFIINRKKKWPTFVAQIFCLCLSDLFVGFVSLPYIILPIAKPDNVLIPRIWCSLMLYLLLCSQCGSLYHMFTICVQRCFRIERSTTLDTESSNSRRAPFCFAILAWIAGFSLITVPFLFWTNSDGMLQVCLLQDIFAELKKAMGYFMLVSYLPQGLTNILYLVACVRLHCIWRRVFPAPTQSSGPLDASTSSGSGSSGYSRTNIRLQRRFMGTLGIVMLLFNLCTLPVFCAWILENKYNVSDRNIRFLACGFFVLNSALNPFVYAFRSSWLKNALKRMFRSISDCFVCF